jgi:hypothetical protein
MESRHEDNVIDDVFRIAKAVRTHLAEPDGCKHTLREVMKEALQEDEK